VIERRGGGDVKETMRSLAAKYPGKDLAAASVQDFHSLKQSLNVASADQRLLVWVVDNESTHLEVKERLKKVMNDVDVVGRFHVDFVSAGDQGWAEVVSGEVAKEGLFVIRAGEFGVDGDVMQELPLGAGMKVIRKALLETNERYAKLEKRKVYGEHVLKGRREGVSFENVMPAGEDRNGDGKIDTRGQRR